MVLGIGEGSLSLFINGSQFHPGQSITGRVQLQLNEPKEARGLRIAFYGEVKRHRGRHTHIERVYEARQQLSGERSYRSGESFDFSLAIAPNALPPRIDGFFGGVAEFFYSLSPTRFFVDASLDMPNKFDINRKVQVQLVRAPGTPLQSAQGYMAQQEIPQGGTQVKSWGV